MGTEPLPDDLKQMIVDYYGQRNLKLLNGMMALYSAILTLVDDGFEVLRATVPPTGKPVIWLRNSALNARFGAVTTIRRNGEYGRELVWAVPYRGVQLNWTEKGN